MRRIAPALSRPRRAVNIALTLVALALWIGGGLWLMSRGHSDGCFNDGAAQMYDCK